MLESNTRNPVTASLVVVVTRAGTVDATDAVTVDSGSYERVT